MEIDGATASTFKVTGTTEGDILRYTCDITDGYNTSDIWFTVYVIGQTATSADSAVELTTGSTYASMEGYGSKMYFKITPTVSDTYIIYSVDAKETEAYLYDSDMNKLKYNDGYDEDGNFRITYTLEAGKTYYLTCGWYSDYYQYAGCYQVCMEREEAKIIDISAAAVTLSSSSYTYDGNAKTPTVTVTCNGTTLTKGTDYTVSYSNNTNAGTAKVTITGCGNYTGTITKTFTISKASQTVSVSTKGSTSIKAGDTTTWTAKTTGTGSISYSSSDSSIATVSSAGKVTAKGAGTVKIYATAASTTNYNASSKTLIATITVGLKTPSISSVSQSGASVTVKWAQITGAKGYYVYRSTSKSSGYTKVKTITSGSTLSYKDTASKTNGKTYYYKVYAYSGSTTSSASAVKSIKYMKGTISSLTNTSSGITVKWSKVSGATGYYIYRKAGSGSYSKVKTITSGSTVSWTDTGVKSKNGTTYTYYVQPYNSLSKGTYATMKTVRLTGVSISSVKNSSSKKMTVKWAKNSKATGYQIQYSTSSSFASGNKTVNVTSASTVSKVISSLTKGKTYYVRIRVYKTVSGTKYYSAWSSKKSVKISK